jgi:hypothetical protein
VEAIKRGADLVGGNIKFVFSKTPTTGEWFDSITFVNVKKNIERFNASVGGNLFVRRTVIESIGPFPEEGRSGMDIYWTRQATRSGFRLKYAEKAVAYYPARGFSGVLSKAFRVGKGHADSWKREEKSGWFMWTETLKTFSPSSISEIRVRIDERGSSEMKESLIFLWSMDWLYKITMALGRTIGILGELRNNHK